MAATLLFLASSACILILSVPVLVAVYLVIHLQYNIIKYRHLPSPKHLPYWSSYIFGHANQVGKLRSGEKTFGDFVREWSKDAGHIFVIHIMTRAIVICLTKESVKEFLVSGRHYKHPEVYKKLHSLLSERFMGSSLPIETRQEQWEVRRNMFNPAFHRSYLRLSMKQFNESTDTFIQRLTKRADGKTQVRMMDEFDRVTLDVIAKIGFGFDCETLSTENSDFIDMVSWALRGHHIFSFSPWRKYSLMSDTRKLRKTVTSALRRFRQIGHNVISKRLLELKEKTGNPPNDILSYILKTSHALTDTSLGIEEMIDEFVTFFIAGMETSAITMSCVLMQLSKYPDIMERLIQEVNDVLQDRTYVEFEDLSKMEYLTAIIKESLRIDPPSPGTIRRAEYDVKINGLNIPKYSEVMISMHLMRLEEYFQMPMEFRPERFLKHEIEPNTWFPFMVGPRSCIGQQFAMMEMRVILAKLLQVFRFQWVEDQSYDFIDESTIKPKDGALHYLTLVKQHSI